MNYRKPYLWVMAVSVITVFIIGIAIAVYPDKDVLPSEQIDQDNSKNIMQDQVDTDNEEVAAEEIAHEEVADQVENEQRFLDRPVEDKVCLGLFTTEQVHTEVYYVPNEDAQKLLVPMINNLEKLDKPESIFKGRYYVGINIVYQGLEWKVLNDGSLYHYSSDENVNTEFYAVSKELK